LTIWIFLHFSGHKLIEQNPQACATQHAAFW
jgi:hypothetical protein